MSTGADHSFPVIRQRGMKQFIKSPSHLQGPRTGIESRKHGRSRSRSGIVHWKWQANSWPNTSKPGLTIQCMRLGFHLIWESLGKTDSSLTSVRNVSVVNGRTISRRTSLTTPYPPGRKSRRNGRDRVKSSRLHRRFLPHQAPMISRSPIDEERIGCRHARTVARFIIHSFPLTHLQIRCQFCEVLVLRCR